VLRFSSQGNLQLWCCCGFGGRLHAGGEGGKGKCRTHKENRTRGAMYFGIQVGIILRTDVPLFPLLLLYFYHSFHGSFMKTRCPSLFQYIIITAFIRTADVFMRHPQVQASSLQATWPSLLTCYQHRATITRNTQKAKKEVRPSFLPPSLPDNLFYATKHTLTQ